jgi:prepilin-type N-terminal cleavage/methylation domain-containing protein
VPSSHQLETARRRTSGGFTLVELLIAVAIIGLLIALLSVALGSARRATVAMRNKALVKNIQYGIDSFHRDTGYYPPSTGTSSNSVGNSGGGIDGAEWLGECLLGPIAPKTSDPPASAGGYYANGQRFGPYMQYDRRTVMTSYQGTDIRGYPAFMDLYGTPILYFSAYQGASTAWGQTGGATLSRFAGNDNLGFWAAAPNGWPNPGGSIGTQNLMSMPIFATSAGPGTGTSVAALNSAQYLLIAAGPDRVFCQTSPPDTDDIVIWGP